MKVEPSPAETAWRRAIEAELLALPPAEAAKRIQLMRESRAAWALLLPPPSGQRRALFLGDAHSGTVAGLARLGWRVAAEDPATRTFAERRGAATGAPLEQSEESPAGHTPGTSERPGSHRPPPILPEDPPEPHSVSTNPPESRRAHQPPPVAAFDLVLVEDDASPAPVSLELAASRSRDVVAFTTDNPLAYKRSSGFRADFRLARPGELLRGLVSGERLGAQRSRLARAADAPARAVALYPDRRDFAHVVDWERGAPDLTLGPAERKNLPKLLGRRLGLFPVLTPSYGLWSAKQSGDKRLLDVLLAELVRTLDARAQTPEHLVATRGNAALILTEDWVVRVPLGHRARAAMLQNEAGLRRLGQAATELRSPTPLFLGSVEVAPDVRLTVSVEERLPGFGAGQLTGRPSATTRLTEALGRALQTLPRGPVQTLDEAAARAIFTPRFEAVRSRAGDPGTITALARLEEEVLAAAIGCRIPRVLCHRDLRPKHVVTDSRGAGDLVGVVDWACLQPDGPPLYDLFHFLAQERATHPGWTPARVWQTFTDRNALGPEAAATVARYERALDLDPAWYGVVARAYPVLFGAMAEEHWDFSRPLWVKRMFGIL